MKQETVPLLRSPGRHEPLRLASEQGPDGALWQVLVGVQSGEKFPIRDGIPLLLDEGQIHGHNLYYEGFYNRVAGLYDAAMRLVARLGAGGEEQFRREFLQELEVAEGARVLEVSIGTGANVRYLPETASYFGVDLSWGMLQQCLRNLKRWGRQAELIRGNAEDLPLNDELFDAVLHVGGINAFDDRAKAIQEMIRVAKSGTKIVIVDETAHLMERLAWIPGAHKVLQKYRDALAAPVGLVPAEMKEIRAKDIIHGDMYCLTFRKP